MNSRKIAQAARGLIVKAGWAPLTVFAAHILLAHPVDFYALYPWIDIPLHFFGGVAIAYFLSAVFGIVPEDLVPRRVRAWAQAILVISLTATAAVFWEFAEFTSDTLFDKHAQLGLEDTLLDMALGILGGVCCVLVFLAGGRLGGFRGIKGR